ncbi:NAD(P)H-dependent glycerol-3-phosphate dehydrogenase [Desulfovibrio ferrophilus]|uniref:Glycerol-3-phosphate dehydrogenase [NAD(P)+] n=1 Tax=Desulfovibrio ferrophilus TaxID=241368 RepID=A0A2Z6B2E9_9BACT|nr:NAD(P)H-dependent glycerol-3-phosphate dehydrogenase [Desulfovibrio ferrophilus]BBD09697.1 NAD-dependent glycerol-3-phosphate dehydrogenase domain-containing protein [Desulfovibrio ferrophilus]
MMIAVIGGGAWGTALANAWAGKGTETRLWVRESEVMDAINQEHENKTYLPGVSLDERLLATTNRAEAVSEASFVVFVVPSQFFRAALGEFKLLLPERPVIVCANKGVELQTLATMSDIVAQELSDMSPRFAMISGPSFAKEVAAGVPTAVALGCEDATLGEELREALSTEAFRVYSNPDYRGVELGGALKNIIAIAVGCADGLEFGHNARAALITRGLAEMSRLGVALGADAATFQGLAGMGDLVLTCTGDLSRNRQVGLALGRGMTLDDILKDMKAVAEGVKTTESVHHLAKKLGVPMPITDQLYAVLYEGKDPREAVRELMTRELKAE